MGIIPAIATAVLTLTTPSPANSPQSSVQIEVAERFETKMRQMEWEGKIDSVNVDKDSNGWVARIYLTPEQLPCVDIDSAMKASAAQVKSEYTFGKFLEGEGNLKWVFASGETTAALSLLLFSLGVAGAYRRRNQAMRDGRLADATREGRKIRSEAIFAGVSVVAGAAIFSIMYGVLFEGQKTEVGKVLDNMDCRVFVVHPKAAEPKRKKQTYDSGLQYGKADIQKEKMAFGKNIWPAWRSPKGVGLAQGRTSKSKPQMAAHYRPYLARGRC
ncbi:MAG: hypothetical protein ABIF01_05270 [Candidatus Micrarchaeota archaeon]